MEMLADRYELGDPLGHGRGYALMLRAPESEWTAVQPTFEQFKQAFLPA